MVGLGCPGSGPDSQHRVSKPAPSRVPRPGPARRTSGSRAGPGGALAPGRYKAQHTAKLSRRMPNRNGRRVDSGPNRCALPEGAAFRSTLVSLQFGILNSINIIRYRCICFVRSETLLKGFHPIHFPSEGNLGVLRPFFAPFQ